jgi:hypothetical protein
MMVLHHILFSQFGRSFTTCLYNSIHDVTFHNTTVCHCRCILITSSIQVTNQWDSKLADQTDECEQLAGAVIRVKGKKYFENCNGLSWLVERPSVSQYDLSSVVL